MNRLPENITDVFERITDAFVALDKNWLYTYINKRAGELFGLDPVSSVGKTVWEKFPDDGKSTICIAFHKALAEQQQVYLEEYYPGNNKWFGINVYPSADGVSVFFRCITERKKAEAALNRNEEKYRSLIEQAGDAILIYSLDGTIYEFNNRVCALSGYTREEFAKLKLTDILIGDIILHPDKYATILTGDTVTLYRQFKRKNGAIVEMEITAKMLSDGKVLGMARDITERRKAEDKIRESEIKYRTLMQQAGDYILLFSNTGQLLEANYSARQLLGYSIDEYNKMSLMDIFFEEDIKNSPLRFDLLNKGESVISRRRLKRKDGTAVETEIHAKKLSDGTYLGVARDLTERLKSIEQLRESEEKYHTLVEHASDGIVIVGANGTCIDANSTICNMVGYTKEELSSINLFELVIINKGDVPFRIAEVLAGKSVLQERNIIKKDGNILSVELNSKLLPDKRILVIVRDITERRKIEDALRQSNERNDIVAKATNDVIWDWNLVTGKVYRSPEGLKKVYGYDHNAPIEMVTEWSRQVHPDDREMMSKMVEKIYQSPDQIVFSVEYRFLKQDSGKYVNVFDRGYVIRDEQGKPVRMIGAAQDITERKKAEEKILKSEEQYKDLVDNITDLICTHDLNGRVLSANRAAERLIGFKFSSQKNLNIRDILTADTKNNLDLYLAEIRTKGHARGLMKVQTKTGEVRIWEYNNSLKTTGVETPVVRGYARDITERKNAEDLVKKQKKQYDELVKNIPVGVYKFRMKPDGSMSFDYVSPRLCEMIGIKEEDVYQDIMNAFRVVHPDDFGGFIQSIKESFITKQNFSWEGRGIIGNQLKWMRIESTPKVLGNGDTLWDGVISDITENKKAEAALRESEETFRRLFNESADAVLLLDDTGFSDCNQAAVAIFGYPSKEEILNKKPWDISPERQPDGRLSTEKAEEMIAKALQQGYNRFEWVHIKSDGTEFPVEVMLTSIILKGRQSFYSLLRDITERKKAEERIRINEERLTKAQQIGKLGYWQQELNSKMIWGSEEARKIYGFSPVAGELAEEIVAACIPDFEMVRQAAVDLVKQNKKYDIEFQINPADGSPSKYISALAEIEKDEQGVPVRIMGVLRDITEYKKAEEQIIKEKDLSDSAINSLPGVFYLVDSNGKFLRWNRNFETVSGFSAAEISSMHPLDFAAPEEKEMIAGKISEIFQKGFTEVEASFFSKNKERTPYHLNGRKIEYEGKSCLIGMGMDITERKKAESKLRSSEETRKLIMDSTLDAIVSMNKDGFITGWTSQAEKIFGWTEAEVMGKTVAETIIPPGYRERQRKGFKQYLKTGKGRFINNLVEVSALNKEGKEFPVEMMITPIIQDGAEYFCAFIRNITERKKAGEEIAKANERYELIGKATNDALWEWNLKTSEVWGNEIFYKIYGLERGRDSLDNLQFYSRTHPEDIPQLQSVLADAYEQKAQSLVMEFRFRMPDDSYKTFLDRAFIYYDDNGKPARLIGAMQDITERKKAEQQIKSSNEQLRQLAAHLQSVREEERKRIGREIHDELGQQLTAIKMDVAWINKKIPDLPAGIDKASLIKSKLQNIIGLLDGSNQSVRKILSELRPALLDDHGLLEALEWQGEQFTEATGIPVKFTTDETELKLTQETTNCIFRVYQESLTNIMRYAKAKKVFTTLHIAGENILLTVEDDGAGFNTEKMKNKKTFGILGIRERVLSLGGKFELISAKGKGTKISISLPYQD
ncbi:MAG: PAS domain S-box protein [Sphingobacteriales bacterium]|nr:PAS domain S-box protein [Sphingobacteriales bacterium]